MGDETQRAIRSKNGPIGGQPLEAMQQLGRERLQLRQARRLIEQIQDTPWAQQLPNHGQFGRRIDPEQVDVDGEDL
jgi:hypothetical protein